MEILICDYCQNQITGKNQIFESSAYQNDEGFIMHKDCAKRYIAEHNEGKKIVSPKTKFEPVYK